MVAAILVFAITMSGVINLAERAMQDNTQSTTEEVTAPLIRATTEV